MRVEITIEVDLDDETKEIKGIEFPACLDECNREKHLTVEDGGEEIAMWELSKVITAGFKLLKSST